MTAVSKVYEKLEQCFRPQECTDVFPIIGEQCHNTDEIGRVFTATFASDEVFAALDAQDAHDCLLFTHHPAPQRSDLNAPAPAIAQRHFDWMRQRRVNLFSYHIPLDRNSEWSPGTNLARAVGLTPYEEFYEQNGVRMGLLCRSTWTTLDELVNALARAVGHEVRTYPYGGPGLSEGRVAVMAGGASNRAIYSELREKGIQAFVTGVTNPAVSWVAGIHEEARQNGVSLVGGGHYSTEKFAPMAMVRFFENLGLPAQFIPETPNMAEL